MVGLDETDSLQELRVRISLVLVYFEVLTDFNLASGRNTMQKKHRNQCSPGAVSGRENKRTGWLRGAPPSTRCSIEQRGTFTDDAGLGRKRVQHTVM